VAHDIRVIPKLDEARRLALAHNVVPVTHSFLSDLETPVSAFLKLGAPSRSFLLESAEHGQHTGRYSFLGVGARALLTYADGVLTVEEAGATVRIPADDPFDAVDELMAGYSSAPLPDLPPLAGGLVGYFGYDLVRRLEHLPDAPPDDLGLPEMAFLLADTVLVFDHLMHTVTIVANAFRDGRDIDDAYREAVARIATVREKLRGPLPAPEDAEGSGPEGAVRPPALTCATPPDEARPPALTCATPPGAYEAGVERIREYVAAGDAFQVVLSRRYSQPIDVPPFTVYRGLRAVNPSPYMYYLAFDDVVLAGSSPEPLVTVSGRQATTRPIAGTRPRGADPRADARLMDELRADPKERAEHVMLVDLGRNDLGRVCRPGTVRVEELMEMETYSHVIHMVSSVTGELEEGRSAMDALKAAFPAGTVSGAPKIRAMEIIDELEPVRRGPYAGAIGYLAFGGDLDTCICIRTIVLADGVAYVQAGAGIVADSDPHRELEETDAKAAALLKAIELAHTEEWGA
jgi:anthranilate synthase component 1